MDQIANLVIDLGIDAAEFKNEIPRIKNLLNCSAAIFFAQKRDKFCTVGRCQKDTFCTVQK